MSSVRVKDWCIDACDPEVVGRFWGEALGLRWGGRNRAHWDVVADVDDLVAAGATVVRAEDGDIGWTVLDDPEGNVFCCFAS